MVNCRRELSSTLYLVKNLYDNPFTVYPKKISNKVSLAHLEVKWMNCLIFELNSLFKSLSNLKIIVEYELFFFPTVMIFYVFSFSFLKFVNALLPKQIIEIVAISQRIVSFLMRSDFFN